MPVRKPGLKGRRQGKRMEGGWHCQRPSAPDGHAAPRGYGRPGAPMAIGLKTPGKPTDTASPRHAEVKTPARSVMRPGKAAVVAWA